MYTNPKMKYKGNLSRNKQRWTKTCKGKNVVNERLQKILEQAQGIKPFNYDNVFIENNELKKHHGFL
jgi:hypothetical protein